MAGKLTLTTAQINDSATATNNFVLKADNAGGVKLSRGNDGATTQDILSVDSSGNVQVNQTKLTVAAGTATPAGGTAGTGIQFGTTSNLGIFFGSGVPSLSAAQGSLYIRTDGSSTSTRLYINTNGSTGWTNVTTAT